MRVITKRKNSQIKNIILQYIDENAKIYLILLIIFFIGIVLGIFFVNNTNETQAGQISEYINNFIASIKGDYQISKTNILFGAIKNNLIIALLLWFLGLSVIGIPIIYLIIVYKGYCIGYTISAIIATIGTGKGILFVFSTMLLQNIIYIPVILTLAVNSIKFYKQIVEDRRKENIKLKIIRYTMISILMFIILVLASFIESYISGTLTSVLVKYC
jgi:stage II sporulation protein M